MFWPKSIPLPPDRTPVWTTPIESPQTHEDIRARAYGMAKAELPDWATRLEVMTAADEIFEYLRYGTKPTPKSS